MPSIENVYWKSLGKKIGPNSEPLSLLYIATYLNHNGHKAEILDCIAECTTLKQFETVEDVVISIDGRTEDILQP